MKLYTRSGDDGTTGLFGGDRVPKDHPRVEAYGTVDELNAVLGLAAAAASGTQERFERDIRRHLHAVQSRLFDIGADLATPPDSPHAGKIRRISAEDVAEVEALIDAIDARNLSLQSFILPGGSDLAARLHLGRTVCRRAERQLAGLTRTAAVGADTLVYLNRLGDLLFAMARHANREADIPDVPWSPREPGRPSD
jgi:cob(I)alamin adenosyltransferase